MADTKRELKVALDHWVAGRREQARVMLKRLIARDPRHPGVNQLYAMTLADQKQFAQAIYYMERAIAAEPKFAEFQVGLGMIKSNTPDWPGAVAAFRKATEIDSRHVAALTLMGALLCEKGQVEEAERVLRRALELEPSRSEAALALSQLLIDTFQVSEALRLLRATCEAHLGDVGAASLLCYAQNYAWDTTPQQALAAPRRFAALLPRTAPPLPGSTPNSPDPDRPLRVGYLSPDLREHSVSFFLEPILRGHDRAVVMPHCYSTGGHIDATTERLRTLCDDGRTWRHAFMARDDELFDMIRRDRIDILVELAGHSSRQRLALMARRPAPVQATYIGFPATTGLPEIDSRLVDAITDPPSADPFAVERLERLEGCFLCYQPPVEAPEPAATAPEHPLTFGSFNVIPKMSDPAVELWARLLSEVSDSRLLLKSKAIEQPLVRARIVERFVRAGVDPSRLELLGRMENPRDHLVAYSQMDVALDPFPYNGTTTTCEALWMGVPVVTLRGDRHVARVGASLLAAAGLGDLVAATPDDYVRIAAALAADAPRRLELRNSLRARLRSSRLCDAQTHSRQLESIYRRMWRRWCGSTTPGMLN